MPVDYDVIFRNAEEVPDRETRVTSGAIPPELEGTFLRNGPGQFRIGHDVLGFFDATGIVAALGFRAGRARLRARFVRTKAFVAEQAAGRQVYRRPFTNLRRGRNFMNLDLANAAMHDAFFFAGRLFATDDPGYHRLDPDTLGTMGEERWGGLVSKMGKMSPVPRVDRRGGRLFSYRVEPSPFGDVVTFFEFDSDHRVVSEASHRLAHGFGFVHEVAFTDSYFVLAELPVKLNLPGVLRGKRTLWQCLERTGESATIHLVPRDRRSGKKAVTITTPGKIEAFYHIANAFEDGGAVVVDGCAYGWATFDYLYPPQVRPPNAERAPPPVLRRYRIDPAAGTITERELCRGVELPRINETFHGRRHRFVYLAGNQDGVSVPDPFVWMHQVIKVDAESGDRDAWDAGPARFVSQPVFAPRPGSEAEDDGWVLAWLVNAETARAEVVVLDARSLSRGPIASIDLDCFLGVASHCRFSPEWATT